MYLKDTIQKENQLKHFLQARWNLSGRLLTDLKKERAIFVNGRVRQMDYHVYPGDEVYVKLDTEQNTFEAIQLPLEIIYEDMHLMVVNKDPFVTVHPTKGSPPPTLLNAISYHLKESGEDYKIRFVNRLDRDTSGVVLVAKNKYMHHQLAEQLAERRVEKVYLAICHGIPPEHFMVEGQMAQTEGYARIFTEDGQYSNTVFNCLERGTDWSLIEARPHTGRTHQIRLHLKESGHPIFGDTLYGTGDAIRQMLHCSKMVLTNPADHKPWRFEAPLKQDFMDFLENLRSVGR